MRLVAIVPLVGLLACRTDPAPKYVELEADSLSSADADGDGVPASEDCDDGDASVLPGAEEMCDGVDNDCDGEIDEGVMLSWFADTDADGFGDAATVAEACVPPDGFVGVDGDCDDANGSVWPGASEVCNGIDDDCDSVVDEDLGGTWYADTDGDGHGDPEAPVSACEAPEGTVSSSDDCDDADADAFPGNPEQCDEVDNNCDGEVDEGVLSTYWADFDADGFGDPSSTTESCALPAGYARIAGDCDDGSAAVNPDASEICNGIDDDCDGFTDDADGDVDLSSASTWYPDGDGDGYGAAGAGTVSCAAPSGMVADATDCDDTAAGVHPGATEVCNGVDDDCNTFTDDADPGLDTSTAGSWYTDGDGDGYGDAATVAVSCVGDPGTVADGTDCDDGDDAIHPGADEVCNGVDDDCNTLTDDDDPGLDTSTGGTWYTDSDGDGYGDAATPVSACEAPTGVVDDSSDCDDGDIDAHPDALETLDGHDDDCDGDIDESVVAMVFAYQCLDNEGHDWLTAAQATQAESDRVELYLDDMDLGMDRYDEVSGGGTGANLEDYELILFSDCGWSWGTGNQAALDEMLDARDLGLPTFAFGDDLGWSCSNVSGEEELTLVTSCAGNGTYGTVTMTGSSHAAYSGSYGTPANFYYDQDMDQVSPWTGVTTLAYSSAYGSGNPVWTAYEDTGNGSRAIALETSIYMNNHAQVSAAAETELEIIFKNSVEWLLDL